MRWSIYTSVLSQSESRPIARHSLCGMGLALLSAIVSISLLIPSVSRAADIQIVDLSDIDFGVVPPTAGDLTASTEFCVAMDPRGRYSLVGRGSGPAGDFRLTERGTGAYSIDYVVQVSDRGRRFADVLQPGTPLTNQRASQLTTNNRCQPPARLRIQVSSNQLQSAVPGHYEGTLSLLVVPE